MPPFRTLLAGLLMLALATYGAIKAYLYVEAEQRVAAAFEPLAIVGDVRYDALDVSLLGPVTLSAVRIVPHGGGETLAIDRLVLEAYEGGPVGPFPARLRIHASGVRIAARALDRLAGGVFETDAAVPGGFTFPGLSALGYDLMNGDLRLDWLHAPDSGAMRLRLALGWHNGAEIAMKLALEDVRTGLLLRRLPTGRFRSFILEYQDHSLAQRLLRTFAEREDMELEALRSNLLARLEHADPEHPWNIGRSNLQQIRAFLGEPKGFVLTAQPYEPIALDELHHYNARDLPLLFNLQLEAM